MGSPGENILLYNLIPVRSALYNLKSPFHGVWGGLAKCAPPPPPRSDDSAYAPGSYLLTSASGWPFPYLITSLRLCLWVALVRIYNYRWRVRRYLYMMMAPTKIITIWSKRNSTNQWKISLQIFIVWPNSVNTPRTGGSLGCEFETSTGPTLRVFK